MAVSLAQCWLRVTRGKNCLKLLVTILFIFSSAGCVVYDLKSERDNIPSNQKSDISQASENIKNLEKNKIPTRIVIDPFSRHQEGKKTESNNSSIQTTVNLNLKCIDGNLKINTEFKWRAQNEDIIRQGTFKYKDVPKIFLDLNPILVWTIKITVNNQKEYSLQSNAIENDFYLDCK